MLLFRLTVLTVCLCFGSVLREVPWAANLQGPTAPQMKSVWGGTYTRQQARRGDEWYAASCMVCHGSDMQGDGGEVPALVDARFARKWDRRTLKELFMLIRQTMPVDRPGTLTNRTSSELLAYILQGNGFPAGEIELSDEPDELARIVFEEMAPDPQ